jgi:hypothetical protein
LISCREAELDALVDKVMVESGVGADEGGLTVGHFIRAANMDELADKMNVEVQAE